MSIQTEVTLKFERTSLTTLLNSIKHNKKPIKSKPFILRLLSINHTHLYPSFPIFSRWFKSLIVTPKMQTIIFSRFKSPTATLKPLILTHTFRTNNKFRISNHLFKTSKYSSITLNHNLSFLISSCMGRMLTKTSISIRINNSNNSKWNK